MPGYVIGNFFVYAAVNAFTPGPGNILALNTVTNYGYKKGKPLFFGIFSGYYVVQILCAIFVFGVGVAVYPRLADQLQRFSYVCLPCCIRAAGLTAAPMLPWLQYHLGLQSRCSKSISDSSDITG